jgi:hypothetical protein
LKRFPGTSFHNADAYINALSVLIPSGLKHGGGFTGLAGIAEKDP